MEEPLLVDDFVKNMINKQFEKASLTYSNMTQNDKKNYIKQRKDIVDYLKTKYEITFSKEYDHIQKLIVKFSTPKYGYDGIYVLLTPNCVVYIGIINFENPHLQAWNFENFQDFLSF